jgi:hypothetical protein
MISRSTSILKFMTRLAMSATNKTADGKSKCISSSDKRPGLIVSATKLVPRGKRKYSFKIPKWARTKHGRTVANVILIAEYTY